MEVAKKLEELNLGPNNVFVIEDKGSKQPWFMARALMLAMGFKNPTQTMRKISPENLKRFERHGKKLLMMNIEGICDVIRNSKKTNDRIEKIKNWLQEDFVVSFDDEEIDFADNFMMMENKEHNWKVRKVIEDGKVWFSARDVMVCLNKKGGTTNFTYRLDNDEKKVINLKADGKRGMIFVSENGLYHLLNTSRITGMSDEEREKDPVWIFQRWINHEVIPAIRNNGQYDIANMDAKYEGVVKGILDGIGQMFNSFSTKIEEMLKEHSVQSDFILNELNAKKDEILQLQQTIENQKAMITQGMDNSARLAKLVQEKEKDRNLHQRFRTCTEVASDFGIFNEKYYPACWFITNAVKAFGSCLPKGSYTLNKNGTEYDQYWISPEGADKLYEVLKEREMNARHPNKKGRLCYKINNMHFDIRSDNRLPFVFNTETH